MSPPCLPPDPTLGTVLRVTAFLDCHARVLGENGFQAIAGSALTTGLVSGLVTIFVAIIGYRLLLGDAPDLREGIGWALRFGFVLALVTSWPAFQALAYRVAVDGPPSLAATILPAAGLPAERVVERSQFAYDTIRLGSGEPAGLAPGASPADQQAAAALARASQFQFEPPLPKTAAAFLLTTVGVTGALRMAVGFLLAIAPLAILGLLFDATTGLFVGWVRMLAGAALSVLGASVTVSLDLTMIEAELARLQTLGTAASADAIDAQALTAIVLLLGMVTVATVYFAARVPSAFNLPRLRARLHLPGDRIEARSSDTLVASRNARTQTNEDAVGANARVTSVVEALGDAARREVAHTAGAGGLPNRNMTIVEAAARGPTGLGSQPLGLSGLRSLGRQTRQARRRDRIS